nr:peptidoglycan recognition protein SA [Bombus impetuosus]ATL64827.1 peptidoglycan recognition protein SA [Bombus picipes]
MEKFMFIIFLLFRIGDGNENCPQIIGRSEWADVDAKSINYLIIPIPYVIIHHTVTAECDTRSTCIAQAENIRSYHMDSNGWDDIGYSFLIGGDGNIYEGRGWNREGAHTIGYNKKSVAIGFIGNFQEKAASDKMLNAAHKLIHCGKSEGILRADVRVIGAKQVTATKSPGSQLQKQIRNWPEWVPTP